MLWPLSNLMAFLRACSEAPLGAAPEGARGAWGEPPHPHPTHPPTHTGRREPGPLPSLACPRAGPRGRGADPQGGLGGAAGPPAPAEGRTGPVVGRAGMGTRWSPLSLLLALGFVLQLGTVVMLLTGLDGFGRGGGGPDALAFAADDAPATGLEPRRKHSGRAALTGAMLTGGATAAKLARTDGGRGGGEREQGLSTSLVFPAPAFGTVPAYDPRLHNGVAIAVKVRVPTRAV